MAEARVKELVVVVELTLTEQEAFYLKKLVASTSCTGDKDYAAHSAIRTALEKVIKNA